MTITLHKGDLPADLAFGNTVAIDTETMGLNPHRDRLCLVQLSAGDGDVHLVQLPQGQYDAPNLCALLANPNVTKLFHFARFDLAVLKHYLGVMPAPVYCTKVASKLTRTFTDRHGLKDLCRDLLGIDVSKQQQSSDWGAPELTRPRWRMPRATSCICISCAISWTPSWRGRGAATWQPRASVFCPAAPSSISKAGARKISSRTERFFPFSRRHLPFFIELARFSHKILRIRFFTGLRFG